MQAWFAFRKAKLSAQGYGGANSNRPIRFGSRVFGTTCREVN